MKDYLLKIRTCQTVIILPIIAIILSLYLILIRYNPIGRTPPGVLLVLASLALFAEWKTIYVYQEEIRICYVLAIFKRNIAIERVSSLEIVIKDDECRLLLALDECLAFSEDKTRDCDTYCLKHPIKVISIRCNKENALSCKQHFALYHIHTDIIYKNVRNNRLG